MRLAKVYEAGCFDEDEVKRSRDRKGLIRGVAHNTLASLYELGVADCLRQEIEKWYRRAVRSDEENTVLKEVARIRDRPTE